MDDAVVEYSTAAGLLSRFRKSTPDQPVASGVWMRPSVPSTNLLAARVSNALELVRNRMFRLDSMLKEQGDAHAPSLWATPCLGLKLTCRKTQGIPTSCRWVE